MKKINILLLAIVSLFLFSTCGENWLQDIQPQGKLLENNYYKSDDEVFAGLVATYSMWKTKYFHAWSSWYMQAALPSDDEVAHGGGRSDRPEYWEMDDYKVSPNNPANQETWDRCYYGVYRANIVINRTEPTSANKKAMIAEAKFLRAWFYFDIVRFWGEAPLYTETLNPKDANLAKSPISDIFNQIVQDLTDAIPDLPATRPSSDKWRVNSYWAHAFLGKVYLYMASPYYNTWGNLGSPTDLYSKAASEFAQVVTGPFSLMPKYKDVYAEDHEWNQESIVEIDYFPPTQNAWSDGSASEGNIDVQLCGVRGSVGDPFVAGWGFDMMTQSLVDDYKSEGDSVRLHGSVLAEWQIMDTCPTAVLEKNEAYTGYYCNKRQTWARFYGGANWSWGINERVLRLGDVYLMYAEALIGSGNTADAQQWYDKIRERAHLATKTVTLEAIKKERRLELAGEGHRFFDLVRWGDAPTVLGPLGFTENKCEHFPIPQRDIDATGGTLVQRDGY